MCILSVFTLYSQHVGTVIFECHKEMTCPVREYFRGNGHDAHHICFLIIESVNTRDIPLRPQSVFDARSIMLYVRALTRMPHSFPCGYIHKFMLVVLHFTFRPLIN